MNHYAVKSWEHFKEKLRKWNFGLASKESYEAESRYSNQFYDDSMLKFVEPVMALEQCMTTYK
jgi:hypothetical protein